jgi:Homing endonuclease associated repeat
VNPGPRQGFRWTPELILYAIELWHRQHLRIPTTDEWDRAGANNPSRVTVIRTFGSWNAAMAAAGFRPRGPGQRRAPSVRARCAVTGRFIPGPASPAIPA